MIGDSGLISPLGLAVIGFVCIAALTAARYAAPYARRSWGLWALIALVGTGFWFFIGAQGTGTILTLLDPPNYDRTILTGEPIADIALFPLALFATVGEALKHLTETILGACLAALVWALAMLRTAWIMRRDGVSG